MQKIFEYLNIEPKGGKYPICTKANKALLLEILTHNTLYSVIINNFCCSWGDKNVLLCGSDIQSLALEVISTIDDEKMNELIIKGDWEYGYTI